MARGTRYEEREPSPTELAWLAGIWEGEGSWVYKKGRTRTYPNGKIYTETPYLKMGIQMTDQDVMERVASIMDGRKITYTDTPAHKAAGQKPIYVMTIQGEAAIRWTNLMWPYLGERRKNKYNFIIEQIDGTHKQVA